MLQRARGVQNSETTQNKASMENSPASFEDSMFISDRKEIESLDEIKARPFSRLDNPSSSIAKWNEFKEEFSYN